MEADTPAYLRKESNLVLKRRAQGETDWLSIQGKWSFMLLLVQISYRWMEVPECFRQGRAMIGFGTNEAFLDCRLENRVGAEKCGRVEVPQVGGRVYCWRSPDCLCRTAHSAPSVVVCGGSRHRRRWKWCQSFWFGHWVEKWVAVGFGYVVCDLSVIAQWRCPEKNRLYRSQIQLRKFSGIYKFENY